MLSKYRYFHTNRLLEVTATFLFRKRPLQPVVRRHKELKKVRHGDSHLTDLRAVSGEEGHSTILLAHYIFLVLIEDKAF